MRFYMRYGVDAMTVVVSERVSAEWVDTLRALARRYWYDEMGVEANPPRVYFEFKARI